MFISESSSAAWAARLSSVSRRMAAFMCRSCSAWLSPSSWVWAMEPPTQPSSSAGPVPCAAMNTGAAWLATFTGLTGRDDLYEQNVTSVRARIDDAVAHNAQDDRGTYVALRVSGDASEALKADNFACAIIDDMGLTNLADSSPALDEPTAESIAAANPDWVFVIFHGDESAAQKAYEEAFVSDPAWQELEATKTGRVVSLPKRLFLYKPNARWAEAYMYVSQLLHGSLA